MILDKQVIRTYKGGREEIIPIETLTKGSTLLVTRICDECGKEDKRKYAEVVESMDFCEGRQLCKKCSQNTPKRKEMATKAGLLCHELHPDRRNSLVFSKENWSRAGKASIKKRKETGYDYKAQGRAWSKELKGRFRDGTTKPTHGKRQNYKGIWFRSTWEVKFAMYLDSIHLEWKYEPKVFPLEIHNSYRPDFFIPKLSLWVEVKGYWRDDAKLKFDEFISTYPTEKIIVVDSLDFDKYKIAA